MAKRAVILGDSHIGCMLRLRTDMSDRYATAFSREFSLRWLYNGSIAGEFSYDLADQSWIRNPIVTLQLSQENVVNANNGALRSPPADSMLLFLVGSVESHALGFDPAWNAYCLSPANDGRLRLPRGLLIDTMAYRLRTIGRVLRQLAEHGYEVGLLAGPPPHEDGDFIAQRDRRQNVPAAETRLQVYQCLCETLAGIAEESKATFFASSPWLADSAGFLKREFWSDGVHTNAAGAQAWLEGLDAAISS